MYIYVWGNENNEATIFVYFIFQENARFQWYFISID